MTRSALGLRLVLVQPIVSSEPAGGAGSPAATGPAVGDGRRVGAVAVEHVLSRAAAGAAIAQVEDSFPTSIAPVSLRPRSEGADEAPRPGAFLLRTPAGAALLEGFVALTDVRQARADWRATVTGWVIVILGVTQLLLIGPLLDRRSREREPRPAVRDTLAASLLLARRCGRHLARDHLVGGRSGPSFRSRCRSAPSRSRRWPRCGPRR